MQKKNKTMRVKARKAWYNFLFVVMTKCCDISNVLKRRIETK